MRACSVHDCSSRKRLRVFSIIVIVIAGRMYASNNERNASTASRYRGGKHWYPSILSARLRLEIPRSYQRLKGVE